MSYDARTALVSSAELLAVVAAELPVARLERLGQGLALIPVTESLFQAVHDPGGPVVAGFDSFPGGFALRLRAWSKAAPVAYLEAGEGRERAAVWVDGRCALGILDTAAAGEGGAISLALSRLGVRRPAGQSEAAAIGLEL